MSAWKDRLVAIVVFLLYVSCPVFLVTGYAALYWTWVRSDLDAAMPYLPWARNFGILAVVCAAAALGILFSSKSFPVSKKTRFSLSLSAAITIALFAEFRNEGKFLFNNLHHFFGPETWIYSELNRILPSLGDFFYRIEYSHWNDFLMGPAIVSALFCLGFLKIYRAFRDQDPVGLTAPAQGRSKNIEHALRFVRILMDVGLFWFFSQAWAEKAGYLSNPHSSDELDLPFEFAGTMIGFWMARVLTRPFDRKTEEYRSTFFVDFLSSGVIGLLYTLIVGPLTEGIASSIGHALYPVVPESLNVHEYTPLQQYIRPFELFLLAVATWWGLNRSSRSRDVMGPNTVYDNPETDSGWKILHSLGAPLGIAAGCLLILATMLSLLEPLLGLGWSLAIAGAGMGAGTVAFLLIKKQGRN